MDGAGVNVTAAQVAPTPDPFSAPVGASVPGHGGPADFANAGGSLQDTTLDEPVMDTVKRDLEKVMCLCKASPAFI
jgi:hypothetical protein